LKLSRTAALLILAVVLQGCRAAPAPPEVLEAERQERDLRGAGASVFAGPEHEDYLRTLKDARRRYERENLKLGWLRDYVPVREDFRAALEAGRRVEQKVSALKSRRRGDLLEEARTLRRRIESLDGITASLGLRGPAREDLARSSLHLAEAERLIGEERFEEGAARLAAAAGLVAGSEKAVVASMGRYLDADQVKSWKRLAEETIAESARRRITVLIVSKLEKKLRVYRNGSLVREYSIGLGFDGLADKRYSGDNATPEGRYSIIRKLPVSQYHKALLINYPNDEDRKSFARGKMAGTIPKSAEIGGQIEIHGGGRDSLTRGCVSLDDGEMDDLFGRVAVGTPVTIVGTTETDGPIIRAIRGE
jgi:L,D-peptidoglycan transpeptidase YkuD (ErfK/YbiS/YcfS/YnhG family)